MSLRGRKSHLLEDVCAFTCSDISAQVSPGVCAVVSRTDFNSIRKTNLVCGLLWEGGLSKKKSV